jgi:hypothetical protein
MSTLFNELKADLEEALDHAAGAPIAGRERTVQPKGRKLRLKLRAPLLRSLRLPIR